MEAECLHLAGGKARVQEKEEMRSGTPVEGDCHIETVQRSADVDFIWNDSRN